MTKEQFDKMIEGLVNPSRIKVAENKKVEELDNELKVLLKRWDDIVQKLLLQQQPKR